MLGNMIANKEKEKLVDNKPLTKKDKKDKETIIVDFKRELLLEKRLEEKPKLNLIA